MKKARIKKQNIQNKKSEKLITFNFKSIFIVFVIIIIIFGAFYVLTDFILKNKETEKETEIIEISAKKILMNDILEQKEDSYYVLVYKKDDTNLSAYSELIEDKEKQFYKVDIDDAMNKKFVSDETNIGKNLDDLTINSTVLLKIENSLISENYTTVNEIEEILKSL